MTIEYGHEPAAGAGIFIDSWGAGPYLLRFAGKSYRFEDSARFGPVPIGLDAEPTDTMFEPNSPFWRAWERWRDEGRKTVRGRRGRNGITWLHCQFSDMRKPPEVTY